MSARTTMKSLVALAAAAGVTALAAPAAGAIEEPGGQPAMCTGRSDPLTTLNAHANGTPKYVINLQTDAVGSPTGVLVLGRAADRLYVDQFCRFWQHVPGQEAGGHSGGEEADEAIATAHAVGFGQLVDGTRVLVRTDVRETDEGYFFRARYRPMGGHGEDAASAPAAMTEDEGEWVTVPAEGWAPLDGMNLR